MKLELTLVIDNEVGERIVDALIELGAVAEDYPPEWDVEHVETLINALDTPQRMLMKKMIGRGAGGEVRAADLQRTTLRGLTGPITKAQGRLVREGKLPSGLMKPFGTNYSGGVVSTVYIPEECYIAFREWHQLVVARNKTQQLSFDLDV